MRSNSKVGLRRVLEAIRGKTVDGQPVRRLGDSTEFAYIRTRMPRGAKEEDGFIYLSDPFIRRLVGPTLKLTERRRMLCYNHVRMIGHAAMMYRTERGRMPKSLEELERADCCPGTFNKDDLICPDGGTYTLSADGMHGVCSHHGHARHLVPCCETPLAWVFPDEAKEYERFRNEYNNYWRTYFDPIALRIQVTPQRYRMETIVLPLINNSIYTGLARALGGKAEPLDALPVPKRNIFSVAAHVNKKTLLKDANLEQNLGEWLGMGQQKLPVDVTDLLTRGLGDQISLNVCDSPLLFDLDMPRFFELLFGSFNGNLQNLSSQDWLLTFLITSLNSPIYVAVPVRDAKVVDGFLDGLDKVLAAKRGEQAGMGWFSLDQDFYKNKLPGDVTARCHCLSLGPVKWRFHWARIGSGFYVASKASVLKDLAEAELSRAGTARKLPSNRTRLRTVSSGCGQRTGIRCCRIIASAGRKITGWRAYAISDPSPVPAARSWPRAKEKGKRTVRD